MKIAVTVLWSIIIGDLYPEKYFITESISQVWFWNIHDKYIQKLVSALPTICTDESVHFLYT